MLSSISSRQTECVYLTLFRCECPAKRLKPSFWFWPGLFQPGSGRTLGCTCKRTSSRAPSSGLSLRGPAVGDSRPASCRRRRIDTGLVTTKSKTDIWANTLTRERRTYSAVLNASWKLSLALLGFRVEYSKASGKKRCTKAQKAMPSFQLEEKLWMSTP